MKNRNEQIEMYRELWDSFIDGTQRFWITFNPMTPAMTNFDFVEVMDGTLNKTMHKTFGYRWKMNKRLPKVLLMPEEHSSKTNGNTLLHYHGVFCFKNEKRLNRFKMCLPSMFTQKVFAYRNKQSKRYSYEMPTVHYSEWDSSRDAFGYTLKQYGRKYDIDDCYVWGKERERK